jgi:hypothetical protein
MNLSSENWWSVLPQTPQNPGYTISYDSYGMIPVRLDPPTTTDSPFDFAEHEPFSIQSVVGAATIPNLAWKYESVRHIFCAVSMHCTILDMLDTTGHEAQQLSLAAVDSETRAIQCLRNEDPPVYVTALSAFFFFWVEVWQNGWDSARPHINFALSTIRGQKSIDTTPDLTEFIELFCTSLPVVLRKGSTVAAMPETGAETPLRVSFACYHAQRGIVWAEGAIAELRRTRRNDQDGGQVVGFLSILVEELGEMLARWHYPGEPPSLQGDCANLESPFSAPMKHLGLFLGRRTGFTLRQFEVQLKLSCFSLAMFAAGSNHIMRTDVVMMLRTGNEMRNQLIAEHANEGSHQQFFTEVLRIGEPAE